jgi:hypothetical protein
VNFAASLDRVERILAAGSWRSAVAGGVALAAYGNPRLTLDLDIVAEATAQDVLIAALEADGYATLYRSSGFSNHQHPDPEWGRLDVIYVNAATADELFTALRPLPGPGGRQIRVPRPEHLIAMKVQAMKNAPERRWQDMADIAFLWTLPDVDRDQVQGYFEKAGMRAQFEDLARGC